MHCAGGKSQFTLAYGHDANAGCLIQTLGLADLPNAIHVDGRTPSFSISVLVMVAHAYEAIDAVLPTANVGNATQNKLSVPSR